MVSSLVSLSNEWIEPSAMIGHPFDDGSAVVGKAAGNAPECLDKLGLQTLVKYQPASRYWSFQWIESGIYVALAAALIAAAVIVVRRRDA